MHIGNFVEVKASRIGAGSRAGHFSYIGDAKVGADVNIGAGTVTCNYDGEKKNETVIEDGAFIGSDTMLVAPVRVGRKASTGAGSVVTKDVPDGVKVAGVPARAVPKPSKRAKAKRDKRPARRAKSVDSDTFIALIFLVLGIIVFILVVAAEAGVIAGMRERAMREPAESRVDALRRFYHERQLTLSSLTLARNLALVGVTAIVVFLVLREWSDSWLALAVTTSPSPPRSFSFRRFRGLWSRRTRTAGRSRSRPFVAFTRMAFRLPVLLLDAPMGVVLRTWQRKQAAVAGGAEELILLIEMEEASASLHEDERDMIRGVIELEFTAVREIMVPRTDIVAVDADATLDDVAALMVERGFSRVPVYKENLDNIAGIVHGKEMMKYLAKKGGPQPTFQEIMRPAYFVPESKKVHALLNEMRKNQISIAIVVDEYGGTAGLVTVEDVLEEIVGEIRDEFDIEEQPVQLLTPDEVIIDARVAIDDLSEMFDIQIKKNDFDSIGGLIINELGRIPSVGDNVRVNGISLKVLSVAGRRIKKVRVTKLPEHEPGHGRRKRHSLIRRESRSK